jgi:outer membrane protein assembly factor BamB
MRITETGVTLHDKDRATPGFTLYANIRGPKAMLLDMEGNIVHDWPLVSGGINFARLLPNGNLFILEKSEDGPSIVQGKAGYLREYDWDGNLVWEHHDPGLHHDGRRLPNGNNVYLGWERYSPEQIARVKGGLDNIEHPADEMWGDYVREITPDGETVWEWHAYDLDLDKYPICPLCYRHEYAHANTCAPLPNGDIMVSFRVLNLLIIVDRETGEVKWEHHDVMLGHQHDCHMLENGNVLVFSNGYHTPKISISRVLEIDPDTHETVWQYRGAPALTFYSPHISGCQRLWSGNTLICEGGPGRIFEVTPDGDVVWEYISPFTVHSPELGEVNSVFRAQRYAPDAPELQGRI